MGAFVLESTDQLKACREYQARWAAFARSLATRAPQGFFYDQYAALYAAWDAFQKTPPENQSTAFLTLCEPIVQNPDFDGARKQLTGFVGELSNWIIDYYNAELDKIFGGQPFEAEHAKYRLSADLHAATLQRVTQAYNHYIAQGLGHLQELRMTRLSLMAQFESVRQIVQRQVQGPGWGETAKNSLLGWMMFANPIVGVPVAAWRLFQTVEQAGAKENQVQVFSQQLSAYFDAVQQFSDEFPKQLDAAGEWIQRKFTEMNVDGITHVLTALTNEGYSVGHYCGALDYAALHEAEQQFQPS